MKALGLDVGERRIGLAVGELATALAVPAGVIKRLGKDDYYQAVIDAAKERGCDTLVVGMPLSMNGNRGPQAVSIQEFVDGLAKRTSMTIETWDERLTSVEADRRLRAVGARAKPVGTQDTMAATIMLQAFLDARREPAS